MDDASTEKLVLKVVFLGDPVSAAVRVLITRNSRNSA
jgi:hypothetical protein